MPSVFRNRHLILVIFFLFVAVPLFSQDKPDQEAGELQKAAQNPVSSLISVPIQNNSNFDVGPNSRTQNVLNIQPVVPLNVSHNWNLIIRWIAPVVWQPAPWTRNLELFGIEENTPAFFAATEVQKTAGVFGFGDMLPTFFLSPAKPGKLIWGVGPALLLPSATSQVLGQGKFGVGPSVVALVQPGHWTLGALINNVWSVAGDSDRTDVNQMTLQYFINYNLSKGWYLSVSPIVTANWKASSGNAWVVPVGGGVGRILRLGMQPVNISAAFYSNPIRPANASTWGMRLQISFMFPKGPKPKK
jgi:hypothetical protein